MSGLLASLCLALTTACSGAAMPAERSDVASTPERDGTALAANRAQTAPAHGIGVDAQADLRPTGVPAPPPASSDAYTTSQVLGKRDRTMKGGVKACEISFVYAGREPEQVFWEEEPCAALTVAMVDRRELERHERWGRLDEFQQKYVEDMVGGKVLYIGGEFTAAVYPIDETGTFSEVTVAD